MYLKDLLKSRKISIAELSRETGIAYMTVNDLVHEKISIEVTKASNLINICDFLDLDIRETFDNIVKSEQAKKTSK